MRLALAALALVAAPAYADDMTQAYAYTVGTAEACAVPIDMDAAGRLASDFALDQADVGKQVWEAQTMVAQLDGQALADWCAVVKDSVVMLGLAP